MNAGKRKLSPISASVIVALFALAIFAGGIFLLIMPERDDAASLTKEIASTNQQISQARALAEQKPAQPIHVADLFKLVKAMPDRVDMPGILLQLNQTASDSGIEFDSITPSAAGPGTNYQIVPIQVEFSGNFYDLNDFLFRLRNLVTVRGGNLGSTGRLFSVESINFAEGPGGFPNIHATLHVNAYVYGTGAPASTVAPPPLPTTPTDTTATIPAPTSTTPAVASGATP